jgi:hypothetical protein
LTRVQQIQKEHEENLQKREQELNAREIELLSKELKMMMEEKTPVPKKRGGKFIKTKLKVRIRF